MTSLAEHQTYLRDSARNRAYEEALRSVASGATVLDLGAGTGVLGMMALRAGARHVYGVELTALSDWTEAIVDANGFGDRYTVLRGSSRRIDLPERVDIIVCDQLGAFASEGEPFLALADAAVRHLKPQGRLLPERVELMAAPVRSKRIAEELAGWSSQLTGFDFSSLREVAAGKRLYEQTAPQELAGPAAVLSSIDPREPRRSLELSAVVTVAETGSVNGIAGFFTAYLLPQVTFTTSPESPDRIDRDNVLLPLDPPLVCQADERLQLRIKVSLESDVVTWSADSPSGHRRHSTFSSHTGLLDRRD